MRERFSKGVYAQITLKNEIEQKENGEVKSSASHCFVDSGSVYDFLIHYVNHGIAADAENWTELACVGEIYYDYDFEIEMVER